MVDVDKAVIARLKKEGKNFEILVDCDKALLFKEGKGSLDDVLATEEIYEDVKKGMRASQLKKFFWSDENKAIAKIIIEQGEIQLTAEHMKKLREEKRKQIIGIIQRNAVDPKTDLPHPMNRIQYALEEAKVNIDYAKSAEMQVGNIVSKIREILPLKYEIREIELKIPAQYSGKSFSILKQFGKVLENNFGNDGSLSAVVEVPAGMQIELFDELNKLCHGQIESKVVRSK